MPLFVPLILSRTKRRQTARQRMGWCVYPWEENKPCRQTEKAIWVHALSVGEVTAAKPLVEELSSAHPRQRIVFTASTLTGFQTAYRLFKHYNICLAYFPYDWLGAVRRVSNKINPVAVILVETDIWPNFLLEMQQRQVPVYLVNLRLSDLTWKLYKYLRPVVRLMFNVFTKICVQTDKDVQRLMTLGVAAQKLSITGNIKFDHNEPGFIDEIITQWLSRLCITVRHKVIVAGSTHAGEEAIVLQAFSETESSVLIVAPRDPRRAAQTLSLARDMGMVAMRLSTAHLHTTGPPPDVIVVDRLGVLKELYALADVAYVGGSLVLCGGHNPLEPAAWGKPVLFGPDMRDFKQIANWLCLAGGARQVADQKQLSAALNEILADSALAEQMGQQALSVFQSHKGAVTRTLAAIKLNSECKQCKKFYTN